MSRRRLLNVTSKKKQDNMVNAATAPDGSNVAIRPYTMDGGGGTVFLWACTARDRVSNANLPTADSVRESQTCFMRGLKEHIRVSTNDATSWGWRRICFTAKGLYAGQTTTVDSLETSAGWVRLLTNVVTTGYYAAVVAELFKGTQNVDWDSVTTAKTDSTKFKIWYDKTRIINSGSSGGVIRDYKMWFPMNKNLVYDDDENGENEVPARYSTIGRPGMGDYYVMDFFLPNVIGTAHTLTFGTEATLYWHEK